MVYNNLGETQGLYVLCHCFLFHRDPLDNRCFGSDEGFIDALILYLHTYFNLFYPAMFQGYVLLFLAACSETFFCCKSETFILFFGVYSNQKFVVRILGFKPCIINLAREVFLYLL